MNNLIQNLLTSLKSTSSAQLTILLFNRSKAMVVAGQQPPTVCTAYNTIFIIGNCTQWDVAIDCYYRVLTCWLEVLISFLFNGCHAGGMRRVHSLVIRFFRLWCWGRWSLLREQLIPLLRQKL